MNLRTLVISSLVALVATSTAFGQGAPMATPPAASTPAAPAPNLGAPPTGYVFVPVPGTPSAVPGPTGSRGARGTRGPAGPMGPAGPAGASGVVLLVPTGAKTPPVAPETPGFLSLFADVSPWIWVALVAAVAVGI